MASKTPPAPVRAVLSLALAVALASCGGGNTAEPIAATTNAASTPAAPAVTQPATPAQPATTPARATTTDPPGGTATTHAPAAPGRARPPGGATPPADPGSGAPASVADEPADTPSAPEDDATPAPAGSPLDERAALVLTRRVSPSHYFQQGTVTGTYDGTMDVEARITSRGVLVRFIATLPGGTISGRALAIAILDSVRWPGLRGTAIVTGGTGRFAGVHGRRLRVSGRARPDASQARVRLTGTVYY